MSCSENLFQTIDARYGRITFFANDMGAVGQSLQSYGEWGENELGFMKALVRPGATVVDVGAYIGTHTLAFAHFVGTGGRVISIEPQNESFALLKRNVAANGLTNVRVEHAAAADHTGALNISPIHITRKESFGSAPLYRSDLPPVGISAGQNQQPGELVSVKVLTIDSLKLNSCALMKIDVEGFEDLVISGAEQTIKRLSPVIYAECNSVAHGIKTFEIMRKFGYAVCMHVVDAFNQDNFLGSTKNIFESARETALVGVSGMQLVCVDQMRPRRCELILKIESADDLALGMFHKPQYPAEVLQMGAAARSGGNAWLKETSSLRDDRDQARDIAHQALQESQQARAEADASHAQMEAAMLQVRLAGEQADASHAQMEAAMLQAHLAREEADASHAQIEAAMLQARLAREAADRAEAKAAELSQCYEKLRASLDEAQANLVHARADIGQLDQALSAVRASRSWRITKPLRMVASFAKSVPSFWTK